MPIVAAMTVQLSADDIETDGLSSAYRPAPIRRVKHLDAMASGITALTAAAYLYGSNRSFGHDEGTTVGYNVANRSWVDALGGDAQYNNHPLSSLLAQIVWRLGGTSELALRTIPILAGALVVGIIFYAVAKQFGVPAALAAALVIASNPLFIDMSREVRGYSLMVLFSVASHLIFLSLLRSNESASRPPRLEIAYSLCVGLAIGAHAFGGLIAVAHLVYIWRSGLVFRPWLTRIGAGIILGGTIYGLLLGQLIRGKGRFFRPSLPLDVALEIGGGSVLTALVFWTVAAVSLRLLRRNRPLVETVTILAGVIGFVWIVMAPFDLYPRFFLILLPIMAIGIARTLAPLGWKAPILVVPFAALSLLPALSDWTADPFPNKEAALLSQVVTENGGRACGLGWTAFSVVAYSDTLIIELSTEALSRCDLVVGQSNKIEGAEEALQAVFEHSGQIGQNDSTMFVIWNATFNDLVQQSAETLIDN